MSTTKTKTSTKTVKEVAEVSATPLADQINAGTVVIEKTAEPAKRLGRPVDPNSARAKKLAAQHAKRLANNGYLPQGRPKVEGSERQIKLAALAAKKADPNYVAKRGRPKMNDEEKAAAKAKRDAAAAAFMAAHKNQVAMSPAELIKQAEVTE